jgi:hypothetical protein
MKFNSAYVLQEGEGDSIHFDSDVSDRLESDNQYGVRGSDQ